MVAPTHDDAPAGTIRHHERFAEQRFPKTALYRRWHHGLDRVAGFRECSGLVCSLAAPWHRDLRAAATDLARRSRILTQESPFLATLVPWRPRRGQLLVYNSYNNERRMARDMFGGGLAGRIATARVARLERHLLRESDVVFACSREDAASFVADHRIDASKIVVVPNGVDIEAVRPPAPDEAAAARGRLGLSAGRPACFFIGSYHPPNLEAVEMIVGELAPRLGGADFLVAGKVCEAFAGRAVPSNVRLLGLVDEADKAALFHGCDVALNPMTSGSGTNLKMLEYLASGMPVATTAHGARGLDLEDGREAMVAAPGEFRQRLEQLLGDGAMRGRLAEAGRAHAVSRFSWDAIAGTVADVYTLKARRRVVFVGDYPVLPPTRGGEVRTAALAHGLAARGVGVTLLSLGRRGITERRHPVPGVEELEIPRTRIHRLADKVLARLAGASADDVGAMLYTRWLTPRYARALRREARLARGIVLSHPFLVGVAMAAAGSRPVWMDAHNCEHDLKAGLFHRGPVARWLLSRVRAAETGALRRARATFYVSESNRQALARLVPSARLLAAPNGVYAYRQSSASKATRGVIFIGSAHAPNVEAARWLAAEVAPRVPSVAFHLVGTACDEVPGTGLPANVRLHGYVDDAEKGRLLVDCAVGVNPVIGGDGTSLKVFDYLAAGLVTVATEQGARGIDREAAGEALVVVPRDRFAETLESLLADATRLRAGGRAATAFVRERHDWSVTLRPAMEEIIGALDRRRSR